MGAQKHGTAIEWTQRPGTKGETLNPIRARDRKTGKVGWYCEHVSEACRWCYAERLNLNLFYGNGHAYKPGNLDKLEVFLDEKTLLQPLHWKAPRTIFLLSMTDLFGPFVKDEWIDKIFAVAALTPQHTYIVLTKRPERMREYVGDLVRGCRAVAKAVASLPVWENEIEAHKKADGILYVVDKPLPNVWLGVSVEDQKTADERIPLLLQTPAAIRFLSCEPVLGPIDLDSINCGDGIRMSALHGGRDTGTPWHINWVIVGGESGPNARPTDPRWVFSLGGQCTGAGIPFFFKQHGEWLPGVYSEGKHTMMLDPSQGPEHGMTLGPPPHSPTFIHVWDSMVGLVSARVGKKKAGRLLDGREWNEFPQVAA